MSDVPSSHLVPQDTPDANPLRSVHTSNMPLILDQLGISLMVTTYQSGKLVMLRPENGLLNTHFRLFDKPMGMAVQPNRIALGTAMQVWEFHNIPAVCTRLDTAREATDELPAREASTHPHDACFLPRVAHWTGDIDIHEMAWLPGRDSEHELVFLNTRFSCLARRSGMFQLRTHLAATVHHQVHSG